MLLCYSFVCSLLFLNLVFLLVSLVLLCSSPRFSSAPLFPSALPFSSALPSAACFPLLCIFVPASSSASSDPLPLFVFWIPAPACSTAPPCSSALIVTPHRVLLEPSESSGLLSQFGSASKCPD